MEGNKTKRQQQICIRLSVKLAKEAKKRFKYLGFLTISEYLRHLIINDIGESVDGPENY